jgi:DNA-binding response OmpR family regulator
MFRKTILIVDDDADIRRLARSALKQEGFDVLQADSGENAWRSSGPPKWMP